MDTQVRRRTQRAEKISCTFTSLAIQNEFNNVSLHHVIVQDNRGDHLSWWEPCEPIR